MADKGDTNVIFVEVPEGPGVDAVTDTLPIKDVAQVTVNQRKPKKPKQTVLPYQEKRIRCPECKYYTTENEEKMTRHIRKMHRGENPFQCYMCDYSTHNKVCFEEHVRVHQGIKPYKCSFCPHRTVSKKNIKKHEYVHRPDNPLKCKQCDYFGRHRKALQFHIKKAHTEYTDTQCINDVSGLTCVRCGLKFENQPALKRHNKALRRCKECDFTGCSKASITLHSMRKHGEMKSRRKKEELFQCSLCKWSSSNTPRVLLHLIHHPNQPVDEKLFDLGILRKHGIVQ